jgi:hypothetical protein
LSGKEQSITEKIMYMLDAFKDQLNLHVRMLFHAMNTQPVVTPGGMNSQLLILSHSFKNHLGEKKTLLCYLAEGHGFESQ